MKNKVIRIMMITMIITIAAQTFFTPSIGHAQSNTYSINEIEKELDIQEEILAQSQQNKDLWDFNDTNEWSNFAYLEGNKTRLIVGIEGGKPTVLSELDKIASKHQGRIVNTVSIQGKIKAVVVELLLASVTAFVEEIRSAALQSYIEPNMKVSTLLTPSDPYWNRQWGPKKIQADWAWNTTVGIRDVLVAVVDTGIDYNHPDLAANYAPFGYDWVNVDADPQDDFGHGTHCAGIIAAVINNKVGIAGLAQVRIMAEKVLGSGGYGYWDWVANGIIHAADQGADIISMSLGGYGNSKLVHDAVKYAYDKGVLLVAAAGNDGTDTKVYPAAYEEVIAVAATDQYDNTAWFSNWGGWVELAAPGVDIYSTMPTYYVTLNGWGYALNYDYLSGTSMACPHVSGVAALVMSQYPQKARDWLRLWLRFTADDLSAPGFDVYYGYGRVNARKAFELPAPAHELIAHQWQTPPYVEPGKLGMINASVINFGENDESNITVQLLVNGTVADSTTIGFLASGNTATVSLQLNLTVEGLYNVTAYVLPVPSEANMENNVLSKYLFVGFPVKAVVLHSAGNILGRIITNWQVLNSEWHQFGDEMVYIDYETLNKDDITYSDIAATGADVLIISCAYNPWMGWEFTDSEIEAIGRYAREGHGLIATAGTFYDYVPNNNKLAPLFGLKEETMWTATGTDLLRLINKTHPVFTKVPNPFVFTYVGTSLPYDRRWDSNELSGGRYLALGHFQESAIVEYRGLLFISPWLEVMPTYYHHHLQLLYNAIVWSRYQKPQHDLSVALQCPTRLTPGESIIVNATVLNLGLNDETNVKLFLFLEDTPVANLTIPMLASGETATISYVWTPLKGKYNVTAYAPPVFGETETSDNRKSIRVIVSYPATIGFVETHGENLHGDGLQKLYKSQGHNVVAIRSLLTPELLADFDFLVVGEDWSDTPWARQEIKAVKDFIASGKGFLCIGDELASSVRVILNGYGIRYTGRYGYSGSSENFDRSHPIMAGVNRIYAPNPVNSLQTTPPGYWIANDALNMNMLIAGAETEGRVLCMSDDFAATVNSEDNEIMFSNIAEWIKVEYAHDLAVSLETPEYLEPGTSVLLNAIIRNRGLVNETNVKLQLILEDVVVNSTIIPELRIDELHTITYLWIPTVEGTYNITAYAPPIENETYTVNNKVTKFPKVTQPLIRPLAGQYANYQIYYVDLSTGKEIPIGLWNFTYLYYVSPCQINVTMWLKNDLNQTQIGWMILNIFTRIVEEDSGISWQGMWYPVWIETNVTIGSPVNLLNTAGFVVNSKFIDVCGRLIDCWEILLDFGYGYTDWFWYDKVSGLWVGMELTYACIRMVLISTNIPIGSQYERDLRVKLQSPQAIFLGESATLTATVYNVGLSDETNVDLHILIDGVSVNSTVIPKLSTGAFYTISYVWKPLNEGTYNVTAYASPVNGETHTEDNVETVIVWVKIKEIPKLPSDRPAIYVNPMIVKAQVGATITVGINIFNLTNAYIPDPDNPRRKVPLGNLYGFDIEFTWDSAILNYVSHTVTVPIEDYPEGALHKPSIAIKNIVDESGNIPDASPNTKAWFVYASLLPANPFNNPGKSNVVFYMTFKVVGAGMSELKFVSVTLADFKGDTILHAELDGLVVVGTHLKGRDVAILNVTSYPNAVYVGRNVNITVVAANVGTTPETFNVTVYANTTVIGVKTISLAPGGNTSLTFSWNTSGLIPCRNFNIWAEASHIPSETNLANNIFADCWVKIKRIGDLNGDDKVDILDIVLAAATYATRPGDLKWNPEADLARPYGYIDICDIVTIASRYSLPP